MKKILSIVFLLLFILLTGCGNHEQEQKNIYKSSNMNVVILAAYRHLAPGNKDGLYCSRVLGVWEPLVTKDADLLSTELGDARWRQGMDFSFA